MENDAIQINSTSMGLFSVPIKIFNFSKKLHELNTLLVDDIVSEVSSDSKGIRTNNVGGWHSQYGLDCKYESFKSLLKIVEDCGNVYCEDFGYVRDIKCKESWVNINGAGDIILPHQHNSSALTAVYYPVGNVDDTSMEYNYVDGDVYLKPQAYNGIDGGSLTFFDPSHGKKIHLITDREDWHNVNTMHIYPTAGVLVLFPTYLIHSVNPFQEKNKRRISISFVFDYDRQ